MAVATCSFTRGRAKVVTRAERRLSQDRPEGAS